MKCFWENRKIFARNAKQTFQNGQFPQWDATPRNQLVFIILDWIFVFMNYHMLVVKAWDFYPSKECSWFAKMSKFWKMSLSHLHTIVEVETVLTFPVSVSGQVLLDLAPSAFYLKKRVSSFAHSFHFLYQLDHLHNFGNCVKQSCKHSHFSIRCKNLACNHEPE